jgi:VanZ family protein
MALIFTLSAWSNPPRPPGVLTDKEIHGGLYGGFAIALLWALSACLQRRVTARMVILTALLACGYGISDEFHQHFVPGRSVEVGDVIADTTGATIAAFVVWAWDILRRSSQSREPSGPPTGCSQ